MYQLVTIVTQETGLLMHNALDYVVLQMGHLCFA